MFERNGIFAKSHDTTVPWPNRCGRDHRFSGTVSPIAITCKHATPMLTRVTTMGGDAVIFVVTLLLLAWGAAAGAPGQSAICHTAVAAAARHLHDICLHCCFFGCAHADPRDAHAADVGLTDVDVSWETLLAVRGNLQCCPRPPLCFFSPISAHIPSPKPAIATLLCCLATAFCCLPFSASTCGHCPLCASCSSPPPSFLTDRRDHTTLRMLHSGSSRGVYSAL